MEFLFLAKVLLVAFSTALIQSIVGIGYALLSAPILTYIMGPKDMVVFILFSDLYLSLIMFYRIREKVNLKSITFLFFGSTLGIIPGIYLLKVINLAMFKMFIGIILLLALISLNLKYSWKRNFKRDGIIFGFLSGFLGASSSVSGPPLVIYALNTYKDKEKIRNTLITFFTVGTLTTLTFLFFAGELDLKVAIGLPFYAVPFLILASKCGEVIFYKLNLEVFRKLVLVLIFVSGIIILYGGYKTL